MDCLTYRDVDMPHVSDYIPFSIPKDLDFPCFNSDHFRLFIAALRSRLKRDGYNVTKSVRYFLCSEYGTDESATHRPHYHVLFYVTDSSINPLYLSNLISDYWKYGRTDGVVYRGRDYVLGHCVFGYNYNSDLTAALRSCGYVSKYVTKDGDFKKVIYSRFSLLEQHLSIVSPSFDVSSLKRSMRQYLRISKGFGLSMLDFVDVENIIKDNGLYLSDSNKVKRFYPLPSYYRRKLFFDVVKFVDNLGKVHLFYQKNELGEKYLNVLFDASVEYCSTNIRNNCLSFAQVSNAYPARVMSVYRDRFDDVDFFKKVSLYNLYVRGRYFTDYYEHINNLDSDFLRVAQSFRYNLSDAELVKHYKNVDYIGDPKCLSDGRRQGFEIDPKTAYFDELRRSDLFTTQNLNSYVLLSNLEPFTSVELSYYEQFMRAYELACSYYFAELQDSFVNTIMIKRKLKKFKNYVAM